MRRVCGEKPGTEVVFVPVSFDNRSDPTPVRVKYKVPTEMERRKLLVFGRSVSVRVDEDGKPTGMTMDEQGNVDRVTNALSELVLFVENYEGRAGPIINGKDLAHHGDDLMVKEVYEEITRSVVLSDGEVKKSDGSSDSQDRTTRLYDGTAETVSPEGSTSKETAMGSQTPTMSMSPSWE